jgi:nicotinamidase-related amidase
MTTAPRRALIVIDVQQEYFDGPLAIQYPPRDKSLARIVDAMDLAAGQQVPTVVVRHEYPEGAPVFAAGSPGAELHPEVDARVDPSTKQVTKSLASVFAGTGLADWLRDQQIDTVTLVGYMTNNCIIGSAADAEPLGFAVEVLSDATGAIHLSNEAGTVSAQQVHETLLALLHSNFAAVASAEAWTAAVTEGRALAKSDLGTSAVQGRAAH